jgi:predicted RNA-binding protein YlxR (DUF448 family)
LAVSTRTCIGCRQRAPAADLCRLVWHDGRLNVGRRGAPGRGASLHPSDRCVASALRTHAFARAFRVSGSAVAILEGALGSAESLLQTLMSACLRTHPKSDRTS